MMCHRYFTTYENKTLHTLIFYNTTFVNPFTKSRFHWYEELLQVVPMLCNKYSQITRVCNLRNGCNARTLKLSKYSLSRPRSIAANDNKMQSSSQLHVSGKLSRGVTRHHFRLFNQFGISPTIRYNQPTSSLSHSKNRCISK